MGDSVASPQEVIERAIEHPADSTPESRRVASGRVVKALSANEYGFMRRRFPVRDEEDGECLHCKREMVHVDHGDAYMTALDRMGAMASRMRIYEDALRRIADGGADPVRVATTAVYGGEI
jgi:hypothetical protein